MGKEVKVWRYALPNVNCEGWAVVLMDSNGMFAVCSDYGNYAYVWRSTGCSDFRQFILGCAERDHDYIATKLSNGAREFDGEATEKVVQEMIIELRRDDSLTKDDARSEWDSCSAFDSEVEWHDFMNMTKLTGVWECGVWRTPAQVTAFCKQVLPRLAVLLRKDLEDDEDRDDNDLGPPIAWGGGV